MAIVDSNTFARSENTTAITLLLAEPITVQQDLIDLLQIGELLSAEFIETQDSTLRAALCGRIAFVLEAIKSALELPLPEIRISQLTLADENIALAPVYSLDSQTALSYCLSLVNVMQSRAFNVDVEQNISELLNHLLSQFLEDVIAPRYIHNENGLKMLDSDQLARIIN